MNKLYCIRIEENYQQVENFKQHYKELTYNEAQKLRDMLIKTGKYSASAVVVRAVDSLHNCSSFVKIVDLTK